MQISVERDCLELRCPVQAWVLPHIRTLTCSTAREVGFNDEDISKIEIAVDEACANVILHAYKNDEQRVDGLLLVRFRQMPHGLQVQVIDSGRGSLTGQRHSGVHDLGEYLTQEKHSGLGTYIMDHVMDEVEFSFPPDQGTTVTMMKRLTA